MHPVSSDRPRTWDGGTVRYDSRGRPTFVIRRKVDGRPYKVSTRTHSLRAALEHLKRFEADPAGYRPNSDTSPDPIFLDAELTRQFTAWSRAPRPHGKGNTVEWVRKQKNELAWWAEKLAHKDLRRVRIDHVTEALREAPGYAHKVRVLKTLYGWLRKVEHRISPSEDPTLDRLTVPQATAASVKAPRAQDRKTVVKVRAKLEEHDRDRLDVLSGTGWHVTELMRFAREGTILPLPPNAPRGAAGVLQVPHKSGEPHRTAVSRAVLAAAKRVLARGPFSREWFDRAVAQACADAGVPVFRPGSMRHTVATWAVTSGEDLAKVSTFLGHKSPRTTKRFYATFAVPAKVKTLR